MAWRATTGVRVSATASWLNSAASRTPNTPQPMCTTNRIFNPKDKASCRTDNRAYNPERSSARR